MTAINCRRCGVGLPKSANHFLDSTRVYCGNCMHNSGKSTIGIHAAEYPNCPDDWHDMYDHVRTICENREVAHAVMLEEAIA